ncbi:hypothetical protein [Marinococcus halophilus]|nr:hypothetical protein [Marinococcus halophilus]
MGKLEKTKGILASFYSGRIDTEQRLITVLIR